MAPASFALDLPKPLLTAGQLSLPAAAGEAPARWEFAALAGRLVELSAAHASAALTLALQLVGNAQSAGETVAWIAAQSSLFYPPDAATHGLDFAALVVVRAGTLRAALRAADHLLRSGGFGLVCVDLAADARVPLAAQTRLLGLARKHAAALLFLTQGAGSGLGSLISLRGVAEREAVAPHRFRCRIKVSKDRARASGWCASRVYCGPPGLR